MKIAGFDWDEGNWPKCGKHGVEREDIEAALRAARFRIPDPEPNEPRYRTMAPAGGGRFVFVVFTYRQKDGQQFIRPISARYMHDKEIRAYERYVEGPDR